MNDEELSFEAPKRSVLVFEMHLEGSDVLKQSARVQPHYERDISNKNTLYRHTSYLSFFYTGKIFGE